MEHLREAGKVYFQRKIFLNWSRQLLFGLTFVESKPENIVTYFSKHHPELLAVNYFHHQNIFQEQSPRGVLLKRCS